MQTQQEQLASQLREVPATFRDALRIDDDAAIRHQAAPGEWSAIEVVGHMIDKMYHWSNRIERIQHEEQPILLGYDQDAEVRKHHYQDADPSVIYRLKKADFQVTCHAAKRLQQIGPLT